MSNVRAIFRFLFAFLLPHRLKSRKVAVTATPLAGGLVNGTSLNTRCTATLRAIECKPRLRSRIRCESDCTIYLHAVITRASRHAVSHRGLLGYTGHRARIRTLLTALAREIEIGTEDLFKIDNRIEVRVTVKIWLKYNINFLKKRKILKN